MIKVAEDKETTPAEATLTTWSFGRRLQSASVSSFPSRNLRVDSPSSASSGRGLIRYSSSLARALFRLASKAKTHRKHYHRILKDKPNYRHISWVLHAHLDFYLVLCFWQKLKIWQICHFLLCWIHDSLLQVWGTWQNSRTLFRVVTWPIYQSLFVCLCVRLTLVEPAFPPGIPLFCWHQSKLPLRKWGRAGVSQEPGCEDQLVSWLE